MVFYSLRLRTLSWINERLTFPYLAYKPWKWLKRFHEFPTKHIPNFEYLTTKNLNTPFPPFIKGLVPIVYSNGFSGCPWKQFTTFLQRTVVSTNFTNGSYIKESDFFILDLRWGDVYQDSTYSFNAIFVSVEYVNVREGFSSNTLHGLSWVQMQTLYFAHRPYKYKLNPNFYIRIP